MADWCDPRPEQAVNQALSRCASGAHLLIQLDEPIFRLGCFRFGEVGLQIDPRLEIPLEQFDGPEAPVEVANPLSRIRNRLDLCAFDVDLV